MSKQLFGFQKTSLRDIDKNDCRVNVLAMLTTLFLARSSVVMQALVLT